MKISEAPEKIYLTKNILGELRDGWDALPSEVFPNIEYTRTDAFIEKASTWISEHTSLSEKLAIEDFKNYIKRE